MTDDFTGTTPSAPGGLAAYALGSFAGEGSDARARPLGGRAPGGRPEGGRAAGGLKVAGLKAVGQQAPA